MRATDRRPRLVPRRPLVAIATATVLVVAASCSRSTLVALPEPTAATASSSVPSAPPSLSATTRVTVDTATPAPAASAAPSAAGSAQPPAGWLAHDVVAALAKDCHYDPGGCVRKLEATSHDFGEEQPKGCESASLLSCARIPDQSCAPDPCSQSDYTCIPQCDRTCHDCAGACVRDCDACKRPCKDDACKLACATHCADCRQSCIASLDRCTTAHCSDVADKCFRDRSDAWDKGGWCEKECPDVQKCVEACPEAKPGDKSYAYYYVNACPVACARRFMKQCPRSLDQICMGNPDASVNFYAYREAHKPQPK